MIYILYMKFTTKCHVVYNLNMESSYFDGKAKKKLGSVEIVEPIFFKSEAPSPWILSQHIMEIFYKTCRVTTEEQKITTRNC